MGKWKSYLLKPFGFTPWPVTILATTVYLALFVSLIVIHHVVPPAPADRGLSQGVDTSEAWTDLQVLTNGHHPYNSPRNDEVRDWLLRRIDEILDANEAQQKSSAASRAPLQWLDSHAQQLPIYDHSSSSRGKGPQDPSAQKSYSRAVVYSDLVSNVTFSSGGQAGVAGQVKDAGHSIYFEGTNIIVYVRGSEDHRLEGRRGGVLVNAHYDSVSTGFGATDDGVGVVTLLQLIKYYTTEGNTPRRGVVLLFNNGEEDFLNGARAFTQHPMSRFVSSFLNLEGAGAGGRATLFRSTDYEVTKFYTHSPRPFGSAVSGDGFKRGLVKSETDYVVFEGELGLRGLDVAFMEPRSRYHTAEDDTKHTSIESLWHMLSAALSTTKAMSSDTGTEFDGAIPRGKNGEIVPGSARGSQATWFELYGRDFTVIRLHTLFALSVSILVAGPLLVLGTAYDVWRVEKLYFFSSKARIAARVSSVGGEPRRIHGWRGLTRFPLAFIIASIATAASALLVVKVNPLIVYSSPYAIWSMTLCCFVSTLWFLLSGAQFVRPSALYRGYAHFWLFLLFWALLVVATVFEKRLDLAGAYFTFFSFAGVLLATLLTLLECLSLPKKSEYAAFAEGDQARVQSPSGRGRRRSSSLHSSTLMSPSDDELARDPESASNGREASETTPLFRENRPTFANYSRSGRDADDDRAGGDGDDGGHPLLDVSRVFLEEQDWSGPLAGPTWLLQLLLMVPMHVILIGQIGLLTTSGMSQTGADGNPMLTVYLGIAVLSIVLLVPLAPFLHRFTYHIPAFLLLVFIGTLIYNLVAFPFSANNRLKLYFVQTVDLDSGINNVSLAGIQPYVSQVISTMPSAAGHEVTCTPVTRGKSGLTGCSWHGLAPKTVAPRVPAGAPPELGYSDWLHFNVSRVNGSNAADFHLYGRNTRACRLVFHSPISDFYVRGAAADSRFDAVPKEGSKEIRLWRREWERPWDVHVRWPTSGDGKENTFPGSATSTTTATTTGLDGSVVCLWSDYNRKEAIPALEELNRLAPSWVTFTKMEDGLVEGRKAFMV
ncbi:MAG: hypothetical protein M1825_006435 [Sarcosagium campestre]|nr:MAG: hypothetical protein M1825_006435 [Sarcosagium campestre]